MDIKKNFRIFRFKTNDGFKVMVGDRQDCRVIAIIRSKDNRKICLEVNAEKYGISTDGQISIEYYKPADVANYTDEQIVNMILYDAQAAV